MAWNPLNHPRDRDGKFRRKTSVGFRVSTRSISVTAGQRFPVVPGRVNLYVGGLLRLENASREKGPISRAADRLQDRAVNAVPEGRFRNIAAGLASSGSFREGSTLISGTTGIRSRPTIRVNRTTGGDRPQRPTQTGGVTTGGRKPRKPRSMRTRSGNTMDIGGNGQVATTSRKRKRNKRSITP